MNALRMNQTNWIKTKMIIFKLNMNLNQKKA